jgi:hypothetical protein
MSNLNRDVLYLIIEQLQDDANTLCSCLLVNKTWCEIIIPILWKNPWKYFKRKNKMSLSLLKVIFSHLSNVSRNKLGELKLLTNSYQNPSFNYISCCKHLDLDEIQSIIYKNIFDKSERITAQNEIFNIFINENMKFTHLYNYRNHVHQLHLNHGAERCFSEIEFLSCGTDINEDILTKLTESCKSIKELQLVIKKKIYNYGIVKLIEAQKKLFNINLARYTHTYENESFCEILENSLIKHANTVQYCKIIRQPSTNFLSSFKNLKELELGWTNSKSINPWNCLRNLSLPFLQILKSSSVPIEALTSLIENTTESLTIIKIDHISHDEISNKKLIQAIYQNCSNLKSLKLLIRNCNILELEKLLISCQYLKGLYIIISDIENRVFNWDKLFEILTKSSPTSLFRFKFNSNVLLKLESLKLFFDNWKGRHPMLLQLISREMIDLNIIERYKEEGIVKKFYYNYWWNHITYNFECI